MAHEHGTYLGGIRSLNDLMERCFVDPDTGCWHWRLAKDKGEPRVWLPEFRQVFTGRKAAVILSGRQIGKGQLAWGTCRSRDCVFPQHIRVGTRAEMGAWQAKRGVLKHNPKTSAAAAANARKASKLSPDAVRAIRASNLPQKELAEMYGVHFSTISKVVLDRSWADAAAPNTSVFSWRPAA